jgi:NAD(P)-dependent dehydrogenase (short-subunit alcohol dehydrogenase family)
MATSSSETRPGTARARVATETAHESTHAVTFTAADLELFAQASHDRNPLHVSADYARGTPFGEPVVFGVLGALAGLSRLRERPHQSLERVQVEFRDTLQVGLEYRLELAESADRARLTLNDGRRTLLFLEAQFRPEAAVVLPAMRAAGAVRDRAAERLPSDLTAGLTVKGSYGPDGPAFAALMQRYRLAEKGIGSTETAALCLASFLVGMELPGERALFSRLTLENLRGGAPRLDYRAAVRVFDQRFDLLKVGVELGEGSALGEMTLEAFVRRDLPPLGQLPRSDVWSGKTALVIGASRGLGAALSVALASQGARVFTNYLRSRARTEALARSVAGTSGEIVPIEGDASDLRACQRMRAGIAERGGLDLLICNAFPLPRGLWIDESSIDRITRYVSDSVRLVATPMSAFLPTLGERGGQLAVVSSAWVSAPPPEWPHYVSAKCAVEGLVSVAAREYRAVRFLVARPPRLLTDMTNTPLGRQRTIPPEDAALAMIARLATSSPPGAVDLLEDNPWPRPPREATA